jgi:hypothetical protein
MDAPTSESVASVVASAGTRGQGIYLVADLRAGTIDNGGSMFAQSPNRSNTDLLNPVETSLGKLVGYNNQQSYNGYINWNNNTTGRGVRSTATQQVSMRDLSNYTVSTTTKETIGFSGIATVHSASASTVRGYFATLPIASWNTGSAGFGTGSAGYFGVIAYKNNVNRPRLATIEQNLTSGYGSYNYSNTIYGIPTSTGSNGGDLNFNAVFNFSTVGLGNTAESVIATIPNIIYSYGTSSNAPLDPMRTVSYKRQGLLIYSNLGGDSGRLYYNRYLVSQSNDSGLGMAIELGSATKLPNSDITNCVLGLVQEQNQYSTGTAGGNFSIPYEFIGDSRGYTDISSATLLFTNGGGWNARIISVTGSTLYTGSVFYLGGGSYPSCWRNENGAQMKMGYSIVGGYGAPNGNTTDPDAHIVLGYQQPRYGIGGGGTVTTASWNANPGSNEWYRFDTSSQQIDTIIISGSKKWRSKAIENLGSMTISSSTQGGNVVCIAMAHTGSSIDIALYMKTGSSFVQLDYLAGVGVGGVDSTDRITLQNFNWNPDPINNGLGFGVGSSDYNVYNSNNTSSISSSNYIAMTYSTNDIDPATKIVYIKVDTNRIKFVNTSSIPTDTYGPYPGIPDSSFFFNHFPIYQSYLSPWNETSAIGWQDPSASGFIARHDSNKPIYATIGSYYNSNTGTSEMGISSIGLY